jgi:DNA protecting protein DprA
LATAAYTREQELHWLALLLVPGLGPRSAGLLLQQFRSPEAIFRATPSELEAAGLPGGLARSIASGCTFEEAVRQQEKMAAAEAVLIPLSDPRYPQRLREIYDPPVALFARGRVELLESLMLAVVGTRRPSPYGVQVAERLSRELAEAGLTIASGMARGIDTAAHKGALSGGGATVAVFGSGLDNIYPAENRRLAEEIAAKGLLVSEFPMSTPAYPQNFPIRNRIVSGMSVGVLVVEGAEHSGSAITARLALEQNREVFAVPGNITSKMSWGPNMLIKEGAHLVQSPQDVIEGLPPEDRIRLRGQRNLFEQQEHPKKGDPAIVPVSGPNRHVAKAVLDALPTDSAINLDDLLTKVENYSSSEVIAVLFELELAGVVRQLPGKNFVKLWVE